MRIKLSELCYKSIACDATEDKKHIDLSSEPLILVCAAGLSGSTADDVAKEIAIYRAHKAAPVVIASEGEERYSAAMQAVLVPRTHPSLAFVLSAMAGHLFSYEAALAIDAQAHPLRGARAAIEGVLSSGPDVSPDDGDDLLDRLGPALEPMAARFFDGLRTGDYDGQLEASTAVRLASQLRYALEILPLESYQVEHGKVGTPSVVIEDLTLVAHPRHRRADPTGRRDQAPGQDRDRRHLPQRREPAPGAAGGGRAGRRRGARPAHLRFAARVGHARPGRRRGRRLHAVPHRGPCRRRGHTGLGRGHRSGRHLRELVSRTEANPELVGTKHRVATQRLVTVARGRRDGRTLAIVPEVKDKQTTGLTLLHLRFHEHLPPATMRAVLTGYQGRFSALKDAVTETEPTFREDLLGTLPVVDLLTEPVNVLADRWRAGSA